MRSVARLLLGAVLFVFLTTSAEAQYFGRNKVQWENFDFKVLSTEHFDIYYYEAEADVVEDVGRMAERWYSRLSRVFNHSFKKKPLVLYANAADFHQTTTTGGSIGEGTGGFTDAFMNRVVLPLTGDYSENDHVLGHEIVHVFQYDIAANAAQNRRRFNLEQMPLWIVEGMAEYLSKGRIDPLTSMWIRDATAYDRLPDIRQLTRDPRYFPYRYGQAVMAYIGARFGDEAVVRYFLAAGSVGIEEGIERATGVTAKQLFIDWQAAARELYTPVFESRPETLTTPLIGRKPVPGRRRSMRDRNNELNIGPAYSPDGKYIAFLSARELFSIDVFLADARTGQIIRKLVSADRDAHMESLRFIESAGAWAPDSRRMAFVTFARGDNFLSIVDVESRNLEHIKVPGLEAISNIAWAPDGRSVVIAGQMTGVSDLFHYDFESKQVRRLTNDKFTDLQPAYSPDGRSLVWISDRGEGSDLARLQFAELRVNMMDISAGTIRQLPLFANAKHISPNWAPDGRSVYFIANPEGIPDIYRHDLDTSKTSRVTAVRTGVAGITDLAPALSVAAKTGELAFSVYEGDNHNIYTLPAGSRGTETAMTMPTGTARAALLPPLRATGSEITAYLGRPEEGLPAGDQFAMKDYRPELKLAYLGPPTLGVGVSEFGVGAGGSVSAWFSDVLGQHNVGFTFEGGGSSSGGAIGIEDQIGGELFYINQTRRLNWGATLARTPYVSTSSSYGLINYKGQPAELYRQDIFVQTITDASLLAQYPFSPTRRIETQGGVQQYGFEQSQEQFIVIGGQIVDRFDQTVASETINLGKASAAFVGDSSLFGFISPIRGTRYRYELETLTGDLNFQTALADWRRYFFMRPLTLAVRGYHYGRYGDDSESQQISPLFLGRGSIARGYDPYTINPVECGNSTPGGGCPALNRLVGSKLAAASIELRAPLFGTREFGLINAPFVPTEIYAFGDVGAAWTEDENVNWKYATDTNERVPVFSAGVGLRLLLSYIPIEVFAAKPFQRPGEDIIYGFNLSTGW